MTPDQLTADLLGSPVRANNKFNEEIKGEIQQINKTSTNAAVYVAFEKRFVWMNFNEQGMWFTDGSESINLFPHLNNLVLIG